MATSSELTWAANQVDGFEDMMADLSKVRSAASSHGVVNCALEATVNDAFELILSLQQGAADHLAEVARLLRADAATEWAREEAEREAERVAGGAP